MISYECAIQVYSVCLLAIDRRNRLLSRNVSNGEHSSKPKCNLIAEYVPIQDLHEKTNGGYFLVQQLYSEGHLIQTLDFNNSSHSMLVYVMHLSIAFQLAQHLYALSHKIRVQQAAEMI